MRRLGCSDCAGGKLGMNLSTRIRIARHRAALSQQVLAAALGVSRSSVSNWESDSSFQPTLKSLQKLAVVTGVAFEWLATGRGPVLYQYPSLPPGSGVDAGGAADPLEIDLVLAFRQLPNADRRRVIRTIAALLTSKRRMTAA